MAERTLAIKYTSEGLSAVTNALGKVAFAFDDALSKAQDSIEEAVKSSNAALKSFDADAFEEAEKKKAQAAKQAANVIKGAYRELGVRSETNINDLKKQAISAFEAMRNSGVASANDIRRAQEQLERKLADLDRQLGDTRNNWDKIRDSVGEVNRAWSSFVGNLAANTVTGIFTSATSAITGFFGQLASNIQRAGIQTENLKAQLKTIEGSVAGAEKAYAQIAEFAKTTPFELNEVTQAYVALANRGLKPTEKQLEQIGDMASSQQKSINQYVEAILDATTGENERLKEFGIRAEKSGDKVSFTFRGMTKTVEATEKAILDTLLGFSELDGVIGGMGERAKTTEGQMSNLSDSLNAVYVQLFDAIKPAQDALIASATAIIEPLSQQEDLYGLIGKRAQELADYLKENPAIIEEIRRQLRDGILITFEAISGTAKQVLQYLKDNPNAIRDAIKSLGAFLEFIKNVLWVTDKVLQGWKAIGDSIRIAKQEFDRMSGSDLIGPVQVSERIKSAGGNDADVRRALDRIQQESSGWSWTDRLFNEGKMQGLVRRVIDEEIRRLGGLTPSAGDFPGPAIPSGGAATLPVPKPAPSRSRSSSLPPPPTSGSTGRTASQRQLSGYAPGFERLGELESLLATNPLFANNPVAMSVALAIASGEVGAPWLRSGSRANLISGRGGTGNAMQGFAQFNTNYFKNLNSPSAYVDFLAQILTGQRNLPTGRGRFNVGELEGLISSGAIKTPQQFLAYLQKAMPIANWEGLFGPGGQRVLQSRVLDVSLDRLTSQIPRSQISRERDSVRAFNSQESERQRENDRLNNLFRPNTVYPEIGVFNVFKDMLVRDFRLARDYAFAQLPNFGEVSPPAEFAGFTFGSSEGVGANIPGVTYPERLLEMATKAREAMEALDARVQIFAQTGSVGVERVSSAFEGLGQRVTDLAQNALGNFFSDVLTGSRSIGDALLDLVSNFASSLLQMLSQMAATGLFRWLGGLFGGGGGFSFGGLFGGGGVPDIFGGGATFSTMALPGFSRGGLVSGRGGKSSDSIFARLSDGEFVLNAAAVDYWGSDFLSSLNSRRLPDLGAEFGQSKGKSGTTIVNNVSVSSPDANSFKRSERQIGRMLSEYAQRS